MAASRSIALGLGIQSRLAETWFTESDILGHAGRYEDAVSPGIRAAELGPLPTGWPASRARSASSSRHASLFALGRWREAAARLEDSFRAVRDTTALAVIEGAVAQIAVVSGRPGDATRHLARQRATVEASILPPLIATHAIPRAELAIWSGDPCAARDAVAAALSRLSAGSPTLIGHFGPVVAFGVRAEADLARAARARAAGDEIASAIARARDLLGPIRALAEETRRLRPVLAASGRRLAGDVRGRTSPGRRRRRPGCLGGGRRPLAPASDAVRAGLCADASGAGRAGVPGALGRAPPTQSARPPRDRVDAPGRRRCFR